MPGRWGRPTSGKCPGSRSADQSLSEGRVFGKGLGGFFNALRALPGALARLALGQGAFRDRCVHRPHLNVEQADEPRLGDGVLDAPHQLPQLAFLSGCADIEDHLVGSDVDIGGIGEVHPDVVPFERSVKSPGDEP